MLYTVNIIMIDMKPKIGIWCDDFFFRFLQRSPIGRKPEMAKKRKKINRGQQSPYQILFDKKKCSIFMKLNTMLILK